MESSHATSARKPPLPGLLGSVAAKAYRLIIGHKNGRFDAGRGVVTFDRAVISVGNLSMGGTGKTPMVLHLAKALIEAGHMPCVAMRGYGMPKGKGLESDEAQAYHRELRALPIVAQPDRTRGLIEMFATPRGQEVDCIILDDGFQHRQIARQFDIVLVDATARLFEDDVLPRGFLREPVESLKRADAVVITHAEAAAAQTVAELDRRVREGAESALIAICRHEWAGLSLVDPETGLSEAPVSFLAGKRVFAACAIGNPGPFLAQAQRGAGELAGALVLKDHAEFGDGVVEGLCRELRAHKADVLLVTEKDWSKLARVPLEHWPCTVVRPRLELRFDRGGEELVGAVVGCVEGFSDTD